MKTWREIKQEFVNEFQELYGAGEANSIFHLIVEYFTDQFRPNLYALNPSNRDQLLELKEIWNRLLEQEPIQYILGYAYFYDLKLTVSPAVLIPRQETEELVHWVLSEIKQEQASIFDIGTGSGAIAIALAKNSSSQVDALDISAEALQVAQRNAEAHQQTIQFTQADMLYYKTEKTYDLIVSNPPYIPEDFEKNMEKNVINFEPKLALFSPNDHPILFYETILKFATKHLRANGSVFFEINEFYKDEIEQAAISKGFLVETKKDLNGNWRMMKCWME